MIIDKEEVNKYRRRILTVVNRSDKAMSIQDVLGAVETAKNYKKRDMAVAILWSMLARGEIVFGERRRISK